jgi:hypothetical protein
MLIKDASNPTPFFTRKPVPELFRTEVDRQKYWAKEKKRWIDGYSEDINGMLYFYATQCILKDRITAKLYYPTVRDADVLIFKNIEEGYKQGKAPFIIKGRGVGFSSIGMNLPFYFWKTNPGATCVATSKDKGTLATLFTEKTMIAYDEMHPDIKPDLVRKNQTLSESYLKTGSNYLDHNNKVKYAESIFLCRDTQESEKAATKFSGAGSIYGFADEAPLMPRVFSFFNSAIEIFKDHSQNKITGLLLMGGTVEDTIPRDAIVRLRDIWNKADYMQILPFFIDATYGKHLVNGHSNREKAREEILRRRDELDKLEDKTALNAYIKNNPLEISEIFNMADGAMFDEYTIQVVKNQINDIGTTTSKIIVPVSIVKREDSFICNPESKSGIKILEHPKPNVEYVFGLDSIMTSELSSTNTGVSDYSFTGMKGIDPSSDLQFCPVALYKERPKTIYQAHETAIRLFQYYNKYGKAKVTGELNAAAEIFISMAISEGLKNSLIKRRDLSDKGYVDVKKFWFYRNDKIKEWQVEAANIYLKKYGHMVWFIDYLNDAMKGENDNKDALDSLMACLYGFGTGDLLGENKKVSAPRVAMPSLRRTLVMDGDKIIEKWV